MNTKRNHKRTWMMGLAAATIMSLIGPRPLFVKTAYADSPSPQLVELVASGIDEGTFELFDAKLHFQGFVTEQVRQVPMPASPGLFYGTWSLEPPRVSGTNVSLGMNASWRRTIWDEVKQEYVQETHENRASSTLTIQFPEVLDPGADGMGQLEVRMQQHTHRRGEVIDAEEIPLFEGAEVP